MRGRVNFSVIVSSQKGYVVFSQSNERVSSRCGTGQTVPAPVFVLLIKQHQYHSSSNREAAAVATAGKITRYLTMADMEAGSGGPRKEIYTYKAPWTVFALSWSHRYV